MINYEQHRKNLIKNINDNSIALFFAGKEIYKTADQLYPFEINRNFYYLTGLDKPNFVLLLGKINGIDVCKLFIEKGNAHSDLWSGKKLSKEEVAKISLVDEENIMYIDDFESILIKFLCVTRNSFGKVNNIYFDIERKNNIETFSYSKKQLDKYKVLMPELQIMNSQSIMASIRMIKSKGEIEEIKNAIKVTKQGIESLMKNSKPNIYEYQLEAYFNFTIMNENQTNSFNTIAASGLNATILHYEDNNSKLSSDDLILFDLGTNSNYYASDISRTFPVSGKFTNRQKEIYNIVLKANKETIEYCKPGVTWKELNEYSANILAEGLIELGLITEKKDYKKYYQHSIGHFLGLDVHDEGLYDRKLEAGMVITIEPGLYIKEESIGIRIEDDILITKNGYENLSSSIIKEVADIEAFMAKK